MGPLQTGYRAALSSVGGKENLKFRLCIFFLFAGRDIEEIWREKADFVHVTYDRVQWRVVIVIGVLRIAYRQQICLLCKILLSFQKDVAACS